MYIDTHAHLFYNNYESDLAEVMARAGQAGIDKIIVPGTDLQTSAEAIKLSEKYDTIYAAVGVHPHDSATWNDELLKEIEILSKHEKVVAIGEIGLDYYYDFSPRDKQIQAFRDQLDLAIKIDLPVIIHNRDANEDIMEIAREYKGTSLRAQYHCFAGDLKDARELISMKHFISLPGNITFKKAEELRGLISEISIESLLLETDSPFMTPVPHRGKRNEPANIHFVAEQIAKLQHLTVQDVARTTSYNANKLFRLGGTPALTFTYQIGDSLYINVTNRCNADCFFCDRKGEAVINGYSLKMKKSEEPEAGIYIKEIGDPKKFKEIVFCGYGEPTIRWEVVKEIARYVKDMGGRTRLNTDGHGNFINKRDITPEMEGLIDTVSISLNSVDPNQYAEIMRVDPSLHKEMIDFAKKSLKYSEVVLSIVGIDDVDKERAKAFVVNEIGAKFRERVYF